MNSIDGFVVEKIHKVHTLVVSLFLALADPGPGSCSGLTGIAADPTSFCARFILESLGMPYSSEYVASFLL